MKKLYETQDDYENRTAQFDLPIRRIDQPLPSAPRSSDNTARRGEVGLFYEKGLTAEQKKGAAQVYGPPYQPLFDGLRGLK